MTKNRMEILELKRIITEVKKKWIPSCFKRVSGRSEAGGPGTLCEAG